MSGVDFFDVFKVFVIVHFSKILFGAIKAGISVTTRDKYWIYLLSCAQLTYLLFLEKIQIIFGLDSLLMLNKHFFFEIWAFLICLNHLLMIIVSLCLKIFVRLLKLLKFRVDIFEGASNYGIRTNFLSLNDIRDIFLLFLLMLW